MMIKFLLNSCLILCLVLISAHAAGPPRDMEREAQIESDLAAKHPELLESFRAARMAFDREDFPQAISLLRDITAKAPDYDVALRRLGGALVRQGKRDEGLQFGERAVALNRSQENLTTLAYSLIAQRSIEQNRGDYERAMQLLRECRALPGRLDLDTIALSAQVALLLNLRSEFNASVGLLQRNFPNQMATHYFAAIDAAMDEQWRRAEAEIKKAEKLGLPHASAQKFLGSGVHSGAVKATLISDALLVFGCWAGGLGLLFAVGFLLSGLTLRQVQPATVQAAGTSSERTIRKIYRVVLNVTGVYYYLSLPIVLLLVVSIAGAIVYGFLMLGRIPIKLLVILVLGAFFTVVAMIKSLFLRVKASDPGRALKRAEAEGLWRLTEEVAQSVGTRPIDEIRITPGTDLAVYERGSWRQKLRNQAERILILGTGVLNGFKQNDFRCVLAHEYGHFSNRDTAGGDIALRVRNDMLKFYYAMRSAGQATYFNAAFHFLRIYNFIFRRISHGATRLQEILADRVAAQIYGAHAFQAGLTHVIRRSIEFEAAANAEIQQSIQSRRPLQNLYQLPAPQTSRIE
ncbi:MAG TPA: M48 family metalloprotease, partial [Verrucomicrobiae bacterium]|nr:M48 family metalloprotease [Verrucomicrobiae bacterium]